MTGTPLQNTVEELFSLLNFLEPERFPSELTFMTEFGDLKTEEQVRKSNFCHHFLAPVGVWISYKCCIFVSQVQKLQGILKPMMLRRLKEDVEKNLAPKEETIIEVRVFTGGFSHQTLIREMILPENTQKHILSCAAQYGENLGYSIRKVNVDVCGVCELNLLFEGQW